MLTALPDMGTDAHPHWVGIVFTDLLACKDVNFSLFEDPVDKSRLAITVDALNAKFGHVVDLIPIHEHYGQVPDGHLTERQTKPIPGYNASTGLIRPRGRLAA